MKKERIKSLTDKELDRVIAKSEKRCKVSKTTSVAGLYGVMFGLALAFLAPIAHSIALIIAAAATSAFFVGSVAISAGAYIKSALDRDNCEKEKEGRQIERNITAKVMQEIKNQEQARQAATQKNNSQQFYKKSTSQNLAETANEPEN